MSNGEKVTLTLPTFEFPDEETKQDFEIAFKGWLKQYQRETAAYRQLLGKTVPETQVSGTQPVRELAYINFVGSW